MFEEIMENSLSSILYLIRSNMILLGEAILDSIYKI